MIHKEEEWMEDPNAFVADEDEDMTTYDARTCGIDLIAVSLPFLP